MQPIQWTRLFASVLAEIASSIILHFSGHPMAALTVALIFLMLNTLVLVILVEEQFRHAAAAVQRLASTARPRRSRSGSYVIVAGARTSTSGSHPRV